MGLIKAGIGALGGTLADQWKEFFYCDAMAPTVMMTNASFGMLYRSSSSVCRSGVSAAMARTSTPTPGT